MTFREQFKEELEEARAEGRAEARAEGVKAGLEQGIRQTALLMIKNDLPDEDIAKYTGLSVKEIEELRKKP